EGTLLIRNSTFTNNGARGGDGGKSGPDLLNYGDLGGNGGGSLGGKGGNPGLIHGGAGGYRSGGGGGVEDGNVEKQAGSGGAGGASSNAGVAGQGLGAAIFSRNGLVTLTNATIAGNSAGSARGVFLLSDGTNNVASAVINNSILGQSEGSVYDFHPYSING